MADAIAEQADPDGTGILELRGHTDSRGAEAYNQMLSERRAQAVLDYMLEVDPDIVAFKAQDRIQAVGFGETQPIDTNDTAEGRQRNRRVEFHIIR